ncbi:MAG TPA: Ig-like domain-containing protein, partial [Candidatus Limnocylindrales bacterium]|nr:Ig-like domain-containing protein [Candidatus Limnocylindrales bacterium]
MGLLKRCATALAAVMALGVLGAAPAHAEVANTAPVAVADLGSVLSGQSVTVSPLANDTDPDPGAVLVLASVVVTTPAAGSAVQSGNDVVITSAPGFVGSLVVTYTVSDGLLTADGTITVDVQAPPNLLPVAVPDVAQMYSGGQLQIDPRANDADPDGEALSVTSAAVSAGAGTVATDGQVLTIGAAAGYVGPLAVTYVVADLRGGQATSTVTVDVIKAPNRAPVAVADAVSVTVGRTYRIPVLANDSDPDGERMTLA